MKEHKCNVSIQNRDIFKFSNPFLLKILQCLAQYSWVYNVFKTFRFTKIISVSKLLSNDVKYYRTLILQNISGTNLEMPF